jgi:hypothetical protein
MGLVILIPLYHYIIYCIPLDYHENSSIISLNHLEIPFFHRNWAIWKTTDVSPMVLVRLALPNSPDPQYTMHVRQKKNNALNKTHSKKNRTQEWKLVKFYTPIPFFILFCLNRFFFNQKLGRTSDDGDVDSDDRYGRAVAASR